MVIHHQSTRILLFLAVFHVATSSDLLTSELSSDDFPNWALKIKANTVVAKDGSGDYRTVSEAIAAAPENSQNRYVIYVKKGVYDEIIRIGEKKVNLTIVGDGKEATIFTGSLNVKDDGVQTFNSATLGVEGDGFLAQDICIRNTAGPTKGQAVALRVSADYAIIYRCKIDAYQDTLYAHSGKQFYRECYITGTVDFICGYAVAVFQYCQIEARNPYPGKGNVITAQSRYQESQTSGFSIQKCKVTASSDFAPIKGTVKTYLGRPWGKFSRVMIMQSFIDDLIDPEGWTPWNINDTERLSTLSYNEYRNYGPGSATKKRVTWKGFRVVTDPRKAVEFTVGQLLDGGSWLSGTGVPYEYGI